MNKNRDTDDVKSDNNLKTTNTKTNCLQIEKEVGKAKLGYLLDLKKSIKSLKLGQLAPYLSKKEDYEVIVRNYNFLGKDQPLEFNGFNTKQFLDQANVLQGELLDPYITYSGLTTEHPSVVSFPPEVTWLANGLKSFETNMVWGLQRGDIGFNKEKAEKIAHKYLELMRSNPETYDFWQTIPQNFESERLSRLFIDWTIELSIQAKAKYLAGLIPIIDFNAPGSVTHAHRVNLAYATVVGKWQESGIDTPKYFYTIALNSSTINRDDWTENLKEIKGYTKSAIQSNQFDGIHVSIRGLSRISNDKGRVNTLLKLIDELNNIAYDYDAPIWWSKVGLIGLRILDEGASFASFPLNMHIGDIYSKFSKKNQNKNNKDSPYGKIFHPHLKEILDKGQVTKLRDGLPIINGVRNKPSELEIKNSTEYRKRFAKPYNLTVFNHLNKEWLENVTMGEINPGGDYLQDFKSPIYYSSWGIK